MKDSREQKILEYIKYKGESSSKEIFDNEIIQVSYATIKRIIAKLVNENLITATGKGKVTKYSISATYELLEPIDIEKYYEKEIDDRKIKKEFNFSVISEVLTNNSVFTTD